MVREMILFLDDDPARAALAFQRMTPDDQQKTFWVETVVDCISILAGYSGTLKQVHLDHDLGGEIYVHPGREDCGMEVVRWLEHRDAKTYDGCKFFVHSYNKQAAKRMTRRLNKAGYDTIYRPFGT